MLPRSAAFLSASASRRTVLGATVLLALGGCTSTPSDLPSRTPSPASRSGTLSPGPLLNVRAFGAEGDGRHDDTSALQLALNAVPAEGGQVHFPQGEYLIRKMSREHFLTFRAATRMTGAGIGKSTIKVANGNGDWTDLLRMASIHDDPRTLSVSDLAFDLNTTGNPITNSPLESGMSRFVIRCAGGAQGRIDIKRCRFIDFSNVNTLYLAGIELSIIDCEFIGAGLNATIGWDHSTIYSVARDSGAIRIEGNHFAGTRSSGGSRTAIETHGGSQVIRENSITDYLTGVNITGIADQITHNVLVTSNKVNGAMIGFRLWSQPYVSVQTGMVALQGVTLQSNTAIIDSDAWRQTPNATGAYGCGFLLNPDPATPMSFVAIEGNDVRYARTNAVTAAPLERLACGVTLSGTGEVRNMSIRNNTFDGCLSAGAMLNSSVVNVIVSGNLFSNLATSPLLPADPALRSMLFLGGKVTGLKAQDNVIIDDVDGGRIRQVVGARPGLILKTSTIKNNVVTRAGHLASIPQLNTLP